MAIGSDPRPALRGGRRRQRLLDAVVFGWVALWIGLGVAIGVNTAHLSDLSRTVAVDGHAVESVGRSLRPLRSIPFVGSQIASDSGSIVAAGAQTVQGGVSTQSSIHALAVLLGIAVALLPSVPVFGFYLPWRVERAREARALRRALREHGDDPALEAYLATRALGTQSYRSLRRLSFEPWGEIGELERRRLAAAELDRFGIDRGKLSGGRRSA